MSDVTGQTGDIYGSPEDWGLSKPKHAEMRAELEDHLYCLQAEEGIPAADAAREELSKPKTRRKLAGVHLTDQVYATLNRLPTKQEWRELIFLLVCFAVILLGDWLAYLATREPKGLRDMFMQYEPTTTYRELSACAWILQSVGRAAFFAGLAASLIKAWKYGAGVMLARILQLKLIHTVLVVVVMAVIGRALWQVSNVGMRTQYFSDWPTWMNAPVILLTCVVLAGLCVMARRRYWPLALGLVLCGVFMFAGGPSVVIEERYTFTLAWDQVVDEAGNPSRIPSTDKQVIEERAVHLRNADWATVDVDNNEWTTVGYQVVVPSGLALRSYLGEGRDFLDTAKRCEPTGRRLAMSAAVATGAGIGWLALPIPVLGVIGFIGLVMILGRRGPVEFIAYSILCVLALVLTIIPFGYGRAIEDIYIPGFMGLVSTPFPAIENLLARHTLDSMWFQLVGGLIFSAGVPWLLTSLFLRPQGMSKRGVDVSNDPLAQ